MFINKIDLPNSSVEIENPVCHRFISNDLRILWLRIFYDIYIGNLYKIL